MDNTPLSCTIEGIATQSQKLFAPRFDNIFKNLSYTSIYCESYTFLPRDFVAEVGLHAVLSH